jgi:RND family efflux transporter MFP subunit
LDGRLEKLLVNDGQRVRKGETLAELRPKTLQLLLAAAAAELRLFTSQLQELKNGSLPEEVDEAEANMLAATALMENADRQWKRLQSLSVSRAASITEIEDAKEQAEATRFALQARRALLKRIKDGPRLELIAQAQARVDLQAERVKQLEDQIDKLAIKAPFDGYIAAESTEVGAWIRQGDPIVQVVQLDKVEIQVPVTAEHAVSLRIGDKIRVEFPELPDELLIGTIDRIVPVADPQTRTYPVYVQMSNRLQDDRPLLMSGMLARADLPSGRREKSTLVPKDALVLNGDERSVFVFEGNLSSGEGSVNSNGLVRKVEVDLGVAVDGLIQVRGDLDDSDLVVVTGNERLIDGTEVSIARINEYAAPELTSSSK